MRDVVVIGGGLTGLAACYELEKQNIRYTVIEVKPRFGGSIISANDNGFVLDGGVISTQNADNWDILNELELGDATYDIQDGDIAFKDGTESLITAFANRLSKGRLMRMAVSSIGRIDGRFTICMENGMMYDAGSLIVASPARFTERMFYTFVPEISERLRDYHYDSIFRVSLGYHKRDLPDNIGTLFGMEYPSLFVTDHPSRVPDSDHLLIQLGVRTHAHIEHDKIIKEAIAHFGWGENPIVKRVHYWSEADPLSCYDDDHHENMQAIQRLLPDGVYLVGSDYSEAHLPHRGVARLDDRIRQGRESAQSAINYLRNKKNANS